MQREQTEIELREFDQLKPVYTIEKLLHDREIGSGPVKKWYGPPNFNSVQG